MEASSSVSVAYANKQFYKQVVLSLLVLLMFRLITIYVIPLNDKTEARYGEIARIMLETGNWVTLMQDYGDPFWAKPPLSTWFSAGSMGLFGVNEFAVRLPALLLSMGILWLVWQLAKLRSGAVVAITTVLVLSSMVYFFIDAGTVMTDPSLLFCTTLIFVSFWRAMSAPHRPWGYLFFVGIGLGLLAKGPIAIVVTGMPIFFWMVLQRKWQALWSRLPWVSGIALALVIALPWYVIAELRTPGFLNYFLIGEHINRFLEPSWAGDKYGFAHAAPMGMIWIFAVLGMLPWSGIGLVWLMRHFRAFPTLCKDDEGWVSYLLCATFIPLVFFTFARNTIYPYVFPSLPMFALLFVELANRTRVILSDYHTRLIRYTSIAGSLFVILMVFVLFKPEWFEKSQNRVVAQWKRQQSTQNSHLVYWSQKNDYSTRFYSAGFASATQNSEVLCRLLANTLENYVVAIQDVEPSIPIPIAEHLVKIATIPVLHRKYDLFRAERFDINQCES